MGAKKPRSGNRTGEPEKMSAIVQRMTNMGENMDFRSPEEVADFKKGREIQAEITQKISDSITTQAQEHIQAYLSFLPTKSTRISIFSPIADKDLNQKHTEITYKSAWGSVLVSGPPLNITDEGILLAILHLIREKRSPIVRIQFKKMCKLLKISYQTNNIRRIKAGIKKLFKTSFDIELKDGIWSVDHILRSARGSNDYTVLEVDPWFFQTFLVGEITVIDMKERQSLRGDYTKALYRFLKSHSGEMTFSLKSLIETLNLPKARELRKIRNSLKRSFAQLKNKNILENYEYSKDVFRKISLAKKKKVPLPK